MPVGRDALEAGDDDDRALVELLEDAVLVDRLDARFRERRVGDEPDLPAREADRLVTLRVDRHGHESDGDLLAGGEELIHLAFRWALFTSAERADVLGEFDQVVGRVAHRGNDDDDVIARELRSDRAAGGAVNAFGVGDTGAAEFLDDEAHYLREKGGIIRRPAPVTMSAGKGSHARRHARPLGDSAARPPRVAGPSGLAYV